MPPSTQVSPPKQAAPQGPVAHPAPAAPTFPPVRGDSQDILKWKHFCAAETSKYPLMRAVQSLGTKSLSPHVKVHLYKHNTSHPIEAIVGSGSRWVVLGNDTRYSQAHCHDRSFSLWDTRYHKIRSVKPAITAYLLRNRHLLPWFLGKKHAFSDEHIVSYNPGIERGGILFRMPMAALDKRYRYVYMVWNTKSNQVINAWTLGIPGCHSAYRAIGTDPTGRTFYFLQSEKAVDGSCGSKSTGGRSFFYRLMTLDLVTGRRRTLSRFAPVSARLEKLVPSRDFSRVAVVEYSESAKAKGKAYVINTRNGTVARFAAPITPYGVVFSKDMSSLLLYSSKGGKIVRVNLNNGQRTSTKTYRLGHAMGTSPDGKHIYIVFHSGVEVRDATTLKRTHFVSHRPMMGNAKFIHVDGSAVLGGTMFLKNGEHLYIRPTP